MQLTDLVMQADDGRALERVSHQFNLTPEQTRAAVEALMPAFSAGIARQTREPQGAAGFLQALGSGRHTAYVDEPDRAFSAQGQAEGVGILGHLFGNKDVSREVTARAAAQSGLSQGLLKKLLPVLAPIVMGAIVKGLTGRSGGGGRGGLGRSIGEAAGGGLLGTILGSLAEGMMSGAGGNRRVPTRQRRRTTRRRRGGGLEDVLGDLMGGDGRSGGSGGSGGLGDLLGGMLGGSTNRRVAPQRQRPERQRPERQRPQRAPRPSGRTAPRRAPVPQGGGSIFEQLRGEGPARRQRSGGGLFGALTEPGGRTDPAYRREVGSVFDQLLGS